LGKLSVATFPAIFLAFDLFVEKRSLGRSLPDKLPFILAIIIVTWKVAGAQPKTGANHDPYVIAAAFVQNFWLLSGFASYVIYRVAPEPSTMAMEFIAVLSLITVFILPFFFRRRWPVTIVLIYWILFSFIPAQVISFTYPVTDRYQFFPSVAAVILIAWGIISIGKKLGRSGLIVSMLLLAIISVSWGNATYKYLSDWRDPRSVWFAAEKKSSDAQVSYNLGWNYMDEASRFGEKPRNPRLSEKDNVRLASAIWQNDQRLPALIAEWREGRRGGPIEKSFIEYLRKQALEAFNRALLKKEKYIMPELYFDRGLLLLDLENLPEAEKSFLASIKETSRTTVNQARQEVLMMSHYDLGVISLRQGRYQESLNWLKMAEEEQTRFGGNWMPDISKKRKLLEDVIASQKSH
jgi:hypothetical protein